MKIVVVENGQDAVTSAQKKAAVLADLKLKGVASTEIVTVDFNDVRHVLPITVAPCVFVMFDEVEGDFEPSNVGEIVSTVRAKKLTVPKKGNAREGLEEQA